MVAYDQDDCIPESFKQLRVSFFKRLKTFYCEEYWFEIEFSRYFSRAKYAPGVGVTCQFSKIPARGRLFAYMAGENGISQTEAMIEMIEKYQLLINHDFNNESHYFYYI